MRFLSVLGLCSALAIVPSCGSSNESSGVSVSLEARLSDGAFRSGRVDLAGDAGRALLIEGWSHKPGDSIEKAGVRLLGDESSLWVPSLDGKGTRLRMKIGAPRHGDHSFSLSAELNGIGLGEVRLLEATQRIVFDLPGDVLVAGLNRLVLKSNTLAQIKGAPTTRLYSLTIPGSPEIAGRFATMRLPAGAALLGTADGELELLVQDAGTLELVAREAGHGEAELDLTQAAGREVIMTAWGENASLDVRAAWRPANVVVVICDTLRNDIIDKTETPALDALAAEGVRFDKSFSHAPMTLPSHTALFSSRYPHVSGIVNNGQEVPQDLPLLSDWLQRGGYKTRAVASLGTLWLNTPNLSLDRGFEQFEFKRGNANGDESVPLMVAALDDLASEQPFFLFAHFADPHEPYRAEVFGAQPGHVTLDGERFTSFHPSDGPLVEMDLDLSEGKHLIEIDCKDPEFTVRAMHFWSVEGWRRTIKYKILEGAKGKPGERFVVELDVPKSGAVELEFWLADIAPNDQVFDRYQQEVVRADQAIGDLIAALKQRDLWDNSLVVFTSDHGEEILERGSIGHVHTLYDEMVHIPLIVKLPKGEAYDGMLEDLVSQKANLVRHIDVVPTILEVIGQAPLPGQMGTSMLEAKLRVLVTETHAPEARADKYACRDDQFKLVYTPSTETFELFDVKTDPGELLNVFESRGAERAEWQVLLQETAQRWTEFGAIEVDAAETERLKGLGYL